MVVETCEVLVESDGWEVETSEVLVESDGWEVETSEVPVERDEWGEGGGDDMALIEMSWWRLKVSKRSQTLQGEIEAINGAGGLTMPRQRAL